MKLMHNAIMGDYHGLKEEIAKGVNVNTTDTKGRTALMFAAGRGNILCVTALLEAKSDVNQIESDGYTALHCASSAKHGDCIRLLIQHKANVNVVTKALHSLPLHLAICTRSVKSVQVLVVAGSDIDRPNKMGSTPLEVAIVNGASDCVEFLLHSGAKMNKQYAYLDWVHFIIIVRRRVMYLTRLVKGVLRKRFKGRRIPKDIVDLLGLYFWNLRLDPKWKKF
jgi:ankyrin repeat protein